MTGWTCQLLKQLLFLLFHLLFCLPFLALYCFGVSFIARRTKCTIGYFDVWSTFYTRYFKYLDKRRVFVFKITKYKFYSRNIVIIINVGIGRRIYYLQSCYLYLYLCNVYQTSKFAYKISLYTCEFALCLGNLLYFNEMHNQLI